MPEDQTDQKPWEQFAQAKPWEMFSSAKAAETPPSVPEVTPPDSQDKTYMSQLAVHVPQVIKDWDLEFPKEMEGLSKDEVQRLNDLKKGIVLKEATRRIGESPVRAGLRAGGQFTAEAAKAAGSPEGLGLAGVTVAAPQVGLPIMAGLATKAVGEGAGRLSVPGGTLGDTIKDILNMGLMTLGAKGAAELKPKTEGVPDASKVRPTTTVHGDVRPEPGQGVREVPVEKGGEGVQPQAPKEIQKQVVLKPQPLTAAEEPIEQARLSKELYDPDTAGQQLATSTVTKSPEFTSPTVNDSNGGATPPPRNSAMSPGSQPPDSNPHAFFASRMLDGFNRWWEKIWPRSASVQRVAPDSPVITEHQRMLAFTQDAMKKFSQEPWWQAIKNYDETELIDLEHQAVTDYRGRVSKGESPQDAYQSVLKSLPEDFRALLLQRDARVPIETQAAEILAVDKPSYTADPYIARLTNEEGKDVVDLHPQMGNLGRQLRSTIGSFDKSRTHPTMKEGIENGTQYDPIVKSVWIRELTSRRLEATANLLRNIKGKVLFETPAEALKASPSGKIIKVRGFGGKDYWARTREEGIFLEQNLNPSNPNSALRKLQDLSNQYIRNPSLLNPLPHTTKNMFFKYILARVNNLTLKRDVAEFSKATPTELKSRFEKVMPFPESSDRTPSLTAKETGNWAQRVLAGGLKINNPSSRFIFNKADPAMRFALWKSYIRKGMGDQEAANHVWLDLVRYDENSGGMSFWKSIPFNFFVPWRTGTYVTLAKAFRAHPVRTLLLIGGIEYLREMRYRKTGRWTHIPSDYVEAPIAEAISNPKTIPGVAASFAVFGPGGGQAAQMIQDTMGALHNDPSQKARLMNMFWGISQLYNLPREWAAFQKTGDTKHLVNLLTTAALAEHSALKYKPNRLMEWLPEWMPGMEKDKLLKQAEFLQEKIAKKRQKAQATYESRHGVSATFIQSPEEQQLNELERAAGVRRR